MFSDYLNDGPFHELNISNILAVYKEGPLNNLLLVITEKSGICIAFFYMSFISGTARVVGSIESTILRDLQFL